MKHKKIIIGAGIVILSGAAFVAFQSSKNTGLTNQFASQNNNQNKNDVDIFEGSLLGKEGIAALEKKNPELMSSLRASAKSSLNGSSVNVGSPSHPQQMVFIPAPQPLNNNQNIFNHNSNINYNGLSSVSLDVNATNKKLAADKKLAEEKFKKDMASRQTHFNAILKESSDPNYGNDQKVPPEQIAFFKDIKQKEFNELMRSLQQISPTHPNKAALEKNIKEYQDYYNKLQGSINSGNVTYAMLLKHDEQHKKIVRQVNGIHQSFITYTTQLYKDQIGKEETDAEYDKKMAGATKNGSPIKPSNSNIGSSQNSSNSQPVKPAPSSPTGNAFK